MSNAEGEEEERGLEGGNMNVEDLGKLHVVYTGLGNSGGKNCLW